MGRKPYSNIVETEDGKYKVCSKCRKLLPISQFQRWKDYRYNTENFRYDSYCAACKREYNLAYHHKRKARDEKYREHLREASKGANARRNARMARDPEYAEKVRKTRREWQRQRRLKLKEKENATSLPEGGSNETV